MIDLKCPCCGTNIRIFTEAVAPIESGGLVFIPANESKARNYAKCKDCKWLNMDEKHSIGYPCINPQRTFRSDTARFHVPSCKACKMYEPKKEVKQNGEI